MHKKHASGWRKHLDFIIIDVICMHISLFLAYAIRHEGGNMYANMIYHNISIVMSVLNVLIAIMLNSFRNVLRRGYFNEFVETLKHVCFVEAGVIFIVFSLQLGESVSRGVFYIFPCVYLMIALIGRYGWKRFLRDSKRKGNRRTLLLVTTLPMLEEIAQELEENEYEGYQINAISLVDIADDTICELGIPTITNEAETIEYVRREWVDAVMVVVPSNATYPAGMVDKFKKMGIVVHRVIARKREETDCRQQVERIGNLTVLTTSMNYAAEEALFIKRLIDILGGIVGCILMSVICLIFGPIIYLHSPGPIFFSQIRVGENGKTFRMYKIRTMYLDAEERKKELMAENRMGSDLMFKLEYDPRIIGSKRLEDGTVKKGIGNFLRETSLDEFPQFINVLKGDMSLVGTRPPTVDEWEQYELHHRARLSIKPGLTGLWQVSGRSNITDFDEVVKLDTKYISEWSFGLDLKIIVKTILVVLGKKGSM